MENHDEQRIASDFFAGNDQAGIPAMIVSALLNTNPVMIYNGQELGERGMDEEGFSGRDGRTTIFDYWSMSSVRNWLLNTLSEDQKKLRATYASLLNIAQNEKAITEGIFYDLMFANEANPNFDPNHQYAFLRKQGKNVIFVVANFENVEKEVRVNIPKEAFSFLQISDNQPAKLTDLFSGEESVGTLTDACPYQLTLAPYSGKVLKFEYK
jgi:glycosidase